MVFVHAYRNGGRQFAKLEFLFLKVILGILIVKQGTLGKHGKIKVHKSSGVQTSNFVSGTSSSMALGQ